MDFSKLSAPKNPLIGNAVAFKNILFGGPDSPNFAVRSEETGELFNMHADRNHRRAVSILRSDIRDDGSADVTIDSAFNVLANGTRVGRLAHFTMRRITEKTTKPTPVTIISYDDDGAPRTNPNTGNLISEIRAAVGNPEAQRVIAEFGVDAFPNDVELDESGLGWNAISTTGEFLLAAIELAFSDTDDVADLEEVPDDELEMEDA